MTVGAAAAAEVNAASSVLLLGTVELAAGVIVASGTVSPSVAVGSPVGSSVGSSDAVGVSSGSVVGAIMELRGVTSFVASGMVDSAAVAVSPPVGVGVSSRRSHN